MSCLQCYQKVISKIGPILPDASVCIFQRKFSRISNFLYEIYRKLFLSGSPSLLHSSGKDSTTHSFSYHDTLFSTHYPSHKRQCQKIISNLVKSIHIDSDFLMMEYSGFDNFIIQDFSRLNCLRNYNFLK